MFNHEKERIEGKIINGYQIGICIGNGTFSKTYAAVQISSGLHVAIKIIERYSVPDDVLIREAAIMKKISHPFIVTIYTHFMDEEYSYLVMELINGDTLLSYINQQERITDEWQLKHIAAELLSALYYLHSVLNIAHRDIKLENIMIDQNFNIKIIDFGLGKAVSNEAAMMSTVCGSIMYTAPEVLNRQDYTCSADIWSLGVVLYCLAIGHFPFYDPNFERLHKIITYHDPEFPENIDEDLCSFISSLLDKNTESRPTARDALNSKYLSDYPHREILSPEFYKNYTWKNIIETLDKNAEVADLVNKIGFSYEKEKENMINNIDSEGTELIKIIYINYMQPNFIGAKRCITNLRIAPLLRTKSHHKLHREVLIDDNPKIVVPIRKTIILKKTHRHVLK